MPLAFVFTFLVVAFEWDEGERQTSLEDHGVDFEDAALIFANPVIEARDDCSDYGELRFRAWGEVHCAFFMVTCTWRGTNRALGR